MPLELVVRSVEVTESNQIVRTCERSFLLGLSWKSHNVKVPLSMSEAVESIALRQRSKHKCV